MSHLKKLWAFSVLGITAATQGCKHDAAVAAPVLTVPVAIAEPATLENNLVLSAEFRPFQEVDVMAKIAGYVRSINVDIGSRVREGTVLATLEVPEVQDDVAKAKAGVAAAEANITTAQAGVQRAEAGANIAQLSFQRIRDVAAKDQGLVPRQEIDVAQARQLEGSAQLASAKSTLKAAEQTRLQAQSDYQRAIAMMQYATIRAPFSGVVTKRFANTGSMIQAGISSQTQAMPVVTLAQNDRLRLTLPVPVNAVGEVHDGQDVEVGVTSLGRKLHGKVSRFSDSVQMATRTMSTEVDVPNPDGSLVPGMYAEVHLHLADHPNTLSVPIDAVDGLGTSLQQAYVVRGNVVHLVPVKVGLQTSTRVEILSGIGRGDMVIVGRHTGLSDGQKVDPQPAAYETAPGHN